MSAPSPLKHSDILFPPASSILHTISKELKRTNLSRTNRLHSIHQDTEFVASVADHFQLPLVANERCGSWYVRPGRKAASAYFKSTDGHFGQWSFSLRRLNLQLLGVIGRYGGCIIVDSTRRGKSMPDALSKTVPIWIAVLNRVTFPDNPDSHDLVTPDDVVSKSEHAQIEEYIAAFVRDLNSLSLDVDELRAKLRRPMEPVWITPISELSNIVLPKSDSHPVVLCTAFSRASCATDRAASAYVQGAADDSEGWALGLDASTFWQHSEQLLSTAEDDLPAVISTLLAAKRTVSEAKSPVLIRPTNSIWLSDNVTAEQYERDFDIVVSCSPVSDETLGARKKQRYIHLQCTSGKVGSRQLRSELPKLDLIPSLTDGSSSPKVLIACTTGNDLSVGVALAVICLFCSNDGVLSLSPSPTSQPAKVSTKEEIRRRLSWILVSMPEAKVSRATLQSVNAILLG